MQEVAYVITSGGIFTTLALSTLTFGLTGWRASRARLPLTTLASYICAFFTLCLTGIAGQLMWG